jgi:hypothetical protein
MALGTFTVLDGNGTPVPIQVLNIPTPSVTWAHVLIDGLAGANVAAITPANALKVDGSGATQPVSFSGAMTVNGAVSVIQGTNTAAVKPPSTGPVASDPALVVAISPNSALTLGSVSIAQGANTASVKAPSTAPVAADPALVVAISPNSPTLASSVAIAQGGNTAAVKSAATAPLTSDPALVVAISPNSPTLASSVSIAQGGNTATVSAGGALKVDSSSVTQPVSIAGSVTVSGTVTANIGAAGALALEGGGNLAAIRASLVAPGTALGSVQEQMVAGSVTTAAPAYSAGLISPLSLTTTGALRVDNSAVTQPISGAITVSSGSVAILQGGNTAAVKAASTAPVAADPALVVTLSPNSPSNPVSIAQGGNTAVVKAASTSPVPADPALVTTLSPNSAALKIWDATNYTVVKPGLTPPAAADAALVVAISPNSQNPNGQATMASSSPVVPASDYVGPVVGNIAAGTTDSGNPVKIGAIGRTTNPGGVTDGQRTSLIADKLGKLITVGAIRILKGVTQTAITVNTETTIIAAGAAGVFNDLYGLILANSSATATTVTIKDATGGTTRAVIVVPAGETRGFMLPVDSAIPQAAAASAWTATCSTAVTTLNVTALWVQNT